MNLKFEILNGKAVDAGKPLFSASNRAIRYGDGLFESIKVHIGKSMFLIDHLERLEAGMKLLHLSWTSSNMKVEMTEAINEFILLNGEPNLKLRILVFRESEGFYTPATDKVSWHISGEIIAASGYGAMPNGMTSGLFTNELKNNGRISNFKTLNCLVSVLAGIAARDHAWDEALIMNHNGNIIESGSSNLFIRTGNSFITPPLSDGCLDGVMRKNVIKLLLQNGLDITEKSLHESDVINCDEILLTNAIAGVRWVENYEGRRYQNTLAGKINDWLNAIDS